jgi:hypothetical protein
MAVMPSVASNMNHTYITQYGSVLICTTESNGSYAPYALNKLHRPYARTILAYIVLGSQTTPAHWSWRHWCSKRTNIYHIYTLPPNNLPRSDIFSYDFKLSSTSSISGDILLCCDERVKLALENSLSTSADIAGIKRILIAMMLRFGY